MKPELNVYSYFASFQVRSAGIMGDGNVLYTGTTNEQRTRRRGTTSLRLGIATCRHGCSV